MKIKHLVLTATLLISNVAKADGSSVREEYDDLMKSSGKWSFLSDTSIFFGVLAGSASVYSYNRGEYYRQLSGMRLLTPHEEDQERMWKNLCDGAGYSSAGLLAVGLIGLGVELHYENRAHQFALDMGVKF